MTKDEAIMASTEPPPVGVGGGERGRSGADAPVESANPHPWATPLDAMCHQSTKAAREPTTRTEPNGGGGDAPPKHQSGSPAQTPSTWGPHDDAGGAGGEGNEDSPNDQSRKGDIFGDGGGKGGGLGADDGSGE